MKRETSEALLFELPGGETPDSSPAAKASCAVPATTLRKMMGTSAVKDEVMHGADDAVLEAELRTVLDAVPAGVLLISPAGRIRFTNEKFAQLFGLDFGSIGTIKEYKVLAGIVESRFRDAKAFSYRWRASLDGSTDATCDELEISQPARRVLERYRGRWWIARGDRLVGWRLIKTSPASGIFSQSCCRPRKWRRWGNWFRESRTN
jgi:PAS domain-containing protein